MFIVWWCAFTLLEVQVCAHICPYLMFIKLNAVYNVRFEVVKAVTVKNTILLSCSIM
jgi:hypothetical protein